jgi:heptosyltransferase-3
MKLRGSDNFPAPTRVLFVQLRRIGDVLLGTPAVRAVAAKFPNAHIDFVAEPPADEAMWGNPHIERLLVAPRGNGVRDWLRFVAEIRERDYDWAIDYFSNPRSAQFTYFSGAKIRVGLDRRGRRWAYTHHVIEEESDRDLYAADLRLKILAMMGVPASGRELDVFADKADPVEGARAEALLDTLPKDAPIAAVSTGTVNPAKLYPPDLTAEVIKGLRREGFSVVVTAGPGETPLAEEAIKLAGESLPILRGARVPTLAALYRRVRLFVGPDSAPKHVAVACGLPTVTLFGLGRAENWNDPMNAQNVVMAPPGGIPDGCDLAEFVRKEYMKTIPPGEIVKAAVKLMGRD